MLDIKAIRQNPDQFKTQLKRKGVDSIIIDKLLEKDERRRGLMQRVEDLKRRQNEASKKMPTANEEEKESIRKEMKAIKDGKQTKEKALDECNKKYIQILEALPNPPHETAADGLSEEDNKVIKTVGEKPKFDFDIKDHADLAESLDLLDTERSAKVSGSRFYYMKNELAILQRALIFWAFMEVQKKGFTAIIPPFLTRADALKGTGYLDKDENYVINPGEDDLYLIGTSEVPMVSYHADEILEEETLPRKYVSYSPCFRREAGTYGKDTRGIFRVHQFEKVEMVIFCTPEQSEKLHEEIREIEEMLLQKLEIPYQVMNVACGDLGNSAAKKYDIEGWIAGQNQYRELTSTSICTDFQTRRLNIRYRTKEGKTLHAHSLNGTAVSGRPLIAILENNQQADGSIRIPKVLQPLCGFEKITPNKS